MHIPDNYLSPSTCAVMTAAAIPAWAHSIKKLKAELPKEKMVMLGVGAAFSFLGMMFNIPMIGGTTGHAVGGTLIALLLGPEAACIAVTIALLVQALLFGDGGILAFGANCFNMAFVLPYVGYYSYRLFCKLLKAEELGAGSRKKLISAGLGSYLGINAAALAAAVEFGIQPMLFTNDAGVPLYCPYSLSISVPAMMIGHLTVFGAAEVIFTVAIYGFLAANSSDSFYGEPNFTDHAYTGTGFGSRKAGILLAALMIAAPLGLLAAGTAWGEWGIDEMPTMTERFSWNALMPDYTLGGLPEWAAYILSAAVGTAIVVIVFRLVGLSMRSKTNYD